MLGLILWVAVIIVALAGALLLYQHVIAALARAVGA